MALSLVIDLPTEVMNQSIKLIHKIEAKRLRATKSLLKVGRAITKWGAIENNPILVS